MKKWSVKNWGVLVIVALLFCVEVILLQPRWTKVIIYWLLILHNNNFFLYFCAGSSVCLVALILTWTRSALKLYIRVGITLLFFLQFYLFLGFLVFNPDYYLTEKDFKGHSYLLTNSGPLTGFNVTLYECDHYKIFCHQIDTFFMLAESPDGVTIIKLLDNHKLYIIRSSEVWREITIVEGMPPVGRTLPLGRIVPIK